VKKALSIRPLDFFDKIVYIYCVAKREVDFYKTLTGRCPVSEFLDAQTGKIAQKITWVLSLLEDLEVVPEKYFKKLKPHEIWECRIGFGGNMYRILAFVHKNGKIVLTHGFVKKTQKTPLQEIELAENYRDDYINNEGWNR
jgi:phage-related protein